MSTKTTPVARMQAWRWDYMCVEGWFPWNAATTLMLGGAPQPRGWFTVERAQCLRRSVMDEFRAAFGMAAPPPHKAPDPDCACGVHAVEHFSEDMAAMLDGMDAMREQFAAAHEESNLREGMVICLSRVTLYDVLPGRWMNADAALAAHPDAIPDPPGTVRAHRMRYEHIMVDREWPALTIPEDARLTAIKFPAPEYVPDLAEWVRKQAADELEAYLDDALGPA